MPGKAYEGEGLDRVKGRGRKEKGERRREKGGEEQLIQNGHEDKPLYDPSLLRDLDFEGDKQVTYDPEISPQNPGENLLMRPLCRSDFDRGYMVLLGQLTKVGEVTREEFDERFSTMENCPDTYYITVIEDTTTGQIIGSASLIKEFKFIRQCSARGRIEDVVVDNAYRGKQLGKLLLDTLTKLGKRVGCYKMSLECLDKVVGFYETFGYRKEEGQNYMCRRYQPK
ncbi:hypothetical protein FSP39_000608 [Pinctada imbricata]|uniref:Glucosamine 6-phosphate N-acetyltransferase n=1 Tax=Pinctada imbricata TaxID=66713 RepID=A0AA89BR00_PINIB|nr:hypothetical protein FSP39_000608 [Pinctada imbricata]